MGHKNVCLTCRTTVNMRATEVREMKCTHCGQVMTRLSHSFRPPRKEDNGRWEAVAYLVKNGFTYNHVYQVIPDDPNGATRTARYPQTLREAKEFVANRLKQ